MSIESETTTSNASGPGVTLRELRTERKLSVERVAAALHLSPRQIVALEEDDYEHLPGPTYVRGYLRSYAHYLGLPAEPLLATFNRLPAATRQVELTAPAPTQQLTSSHALVKLGTVLIAGIVLGLAAIWWAGQDTQPPAPGAAGELAASNGRESPQQSVDRMEPAEPETTLAPTEAEAPPPPTSDEASGPEIERPTATAGPQEAPPVIAPDAPRSRLVLYVHQDSWADVRDARQERLIYDTIQAGRVVTLEGVAPLQVFLGNVDGVRVEFEGRPYDAARYKRGQIARFTLGTAPRPQ